MDIHITYDTYIIHRHISHAHVSPYILHCIPIYVNRASQQFCTPSCTTYTTPIHHTWSVFFKWQRVYQPSWLSNGKQGSCSPHDTRLGTGDKHGNNRIPEFLFTRMFDDYSFTLMLGKKKRLKHNREKKQMKERVKKKTETSKKHNTFFPIHQNAHRWNTLLT